VAGGTESEAGFSLIELLIATAIMGISVIAIVYGMGTLFNSSSQNREATTAAIVLTALSLQMLGDGVRDLLDPKLRKAA
jgi:prepilin-type N-terminal cleavage/methylation domain-containing protein